jgi:hypothetical protein
MRSTLSHRSARQTLHQVVRWSGAEEETLVQLVAEVGEGCWAAILEEGSKVFNSCRTQVLVRAW